MSIEIRDVSKGFGTHAALRGVSLTVPDGGLVALLGPSGAGKTTLLRLIAGLEAPDSGRILFDGRDVADRGARARGVGFVFQHFALFRHMTAFENVAFGLRVKPRRDRPKEAQIREKVCELLRLVQLEGLAGRYPGQLSGGQRQRVALARSLAVEPRVLLLDEPFGALDAKVRHDLRRWLRRLHDDLRVTSVFVTHDQEEALEVADQVVVMNEGKIEQVGGPLEVYERPATSFVCRFLGRINLFHGRVHRGLLRIGCLELPAPDHAGAHDQPAVVYARPHEIELSCEPPLEDSAEAIVRHVSVAGGLVRVELECRVAGEPVVVELPAEEHRALGVGVGQSVYFRIRRSRVFLLN